VSDKTSSTIENYLGVMFVLQRDGEPIIGAHLAELLGVTPPTVTNTLKRMARDGLIMLDEPNGTCLTETGLEAARSVMRKHMLTEWMLMRMLKVPWSNTHSEAHHIEHSISETIEEHMRSNLGDPQLCPHGNPLPGYESIVSSWTPLHEVDQGEQVIIRRIHENAEDIPELLKFLETNGIIPYARAEVCEVLPFNQTITLKIGERKVTLGFPTARYIFVEKNPPTL
jgi:DtxR family Mn-dependent transcriptional regulator